MSESQYCPHCNRNFSDPHLQTELMFTQEALYLACMDLANQNENRAVQMMSDYLREA